MTVLIRRLDFYHPKVRRLKKMAIKGLEFLYSKFDQAA